MKEMSDEEKEKFSYVAERLDPGKSIERITEAHERARVRQEKLLNLPYRQQLIQSVQRRLKDVDITKVPEVEMIYLSAMVTIESPKARIAEIQSAMRSIGELAGLFKQVVDFTARRGNDVESLDDFVDFVKTLPKGEQKRIADAFNIKADKTDGNDGTSSKDST